MVLPQFHKDLALSGVKKGEVIKIAHLLWLVYCLSPVGDLIVLVPLG